ncbi:MAG TPA: DMT family transporter [Candidatus Bathyarchaeia archaeon]|nr:DMT family transporter [Candidatus Bathyarchaeia archaeon]
MATRPGLVRLTHRSLVQTLLGASFWGLSGTAAQALFQIYKFPVLSLVTIRMLLSAVALIVIIRPRLPQRPFLRMVLLGVFGYAGSSFGYLAAIQFSNAATATLLQFLFLPMVAGYEALTGYLHWTRRWTLTLILAVAGTLLLIVGTGLQVLVTPLGLAFGLLAAVSGAYYNLGSRSYVRSHGAWWTTSWGFAIGGLVTLPVGLFFLRDYLLPSSVGATVEVFFLVGFVTVFGTILAFSLYISGLEHLSATETGIASSSEPIMSAAAAYLFLGVVLTPTQYLGGALIILAVVLVAARSSQSVTENTPRPKDPL